MSALSPSEFAVASKRIRMHPGTRAAVRDVLVTGSTWKAASEKHGVTQSGMLKAMRRLDISSARREQIGSLLREALPHLPHDIQQRAQAALEKNP